MKSLKKYLLMGLVVWLPVAATIWVLQLLLGTVDQLVALLPPDYRPDYWVLEQLVEYVPHIGWLHRLPGFGLILVLVVLLWLTPALYHVPQSVLAAVVVTAVTSLIKPGTLLRLWRVSRVEAVIGGVTFALTLATAPRMYWGVLVGLLMNLSHFLYQRLHPRIIEVGLHPDGSLRDRHLWQLPPLAPRLLALRMDAELDFASASALERRVTEHLAAHPEVVHLCLLAQPINRIDVTGVETFANLVSTLRARTGTLHLSGLKLPVEQVLRRAGVLEPGPGLAMYRTDAEALLALQQLPGPAHNASDGVADSQKARAD